jgi:hypothetical protein
MEAMNQKNIKHLFILAPHEKREKISISIICKKYSTAGWQGKNIRGWIDRP